MPAANILSLLENHENDSSQTSSKLRNSNRKIAVAFARKSLRSGKTVQIRLKDKKSSLVKKDRSGRLRLWEVVSVAECNQLTGGSDEEEWDYHLTDDVDFDDLRD